MPSMGGHGTGPLNSEAGFELVAATLTVSTTASLGWSGKAYRARLGEGIIRRGLTVLAFATVVASIGSLTAAASPVGGPKATPAVAPGVGAAATYKNPPNPICSIPRPAGATDYPIDCEAGVGIHNEESNR